VDVFCGHAALHIALRDLAQRTWNASRVLGDLDVRCGAAAQRAAEAFGIATPIYSLAVLPHSFTVPSIDAEAIVLPSGL
jgi:hypothetical protein